MVGANVGPNRTVRVPQTARASMSALEEPVCPIRIGVDATRFALVVLYTETDADEDQSLRKRIMPLRSLASLALHPHKPRRIGSICRMVTVQGSRGA